MIPPDALEQIICDTLTDAQVTITDLTGTRDHYNVRIVSTAFAGQNPLDRRRTMHKVLKAPMEDGRIHAMELKTQTPDEAATD